MANPSRIHGMTPEPDPAPGHAPTLSTAPAPNQPTGVAEAEPCPVFGGGEAETTSGGKGGGKGEGKGEGNGSGTGSGTGAGADGVRDMEFWDMISEAERLAQMAGKGNGKGKGNGSGTGSGNILVFKVCYASRNDPWGIEEGFVFNPHEQGKPIFTVARSLAKGNCV